MRLLAASIAFLMAHAVHAQSLEPATDKSAADIFLSGALTSAGNADTVYTWDIKFTYPKIEKRLGRSSNWLIASPVFEFAANKGTNANPDRISVGGVAAIDFFAGNITRRVVPDVIWSNTVAGEFDRDRTTKGVTYQTTGRLAFRTFFPNGGSAPVSFVPRVEGGVEVGENYVNKLQATGSGRVGRLYGGATAFQELGLPWLTLSVIYQVRRPLRDEISLRSPRVGPNDLRLTTMVRHYVEITPQFRLAKWMFLKPTYKRGSLPPAFNYVDGEFSLSLQVGAKAKGSR
jgi:hypothetical protein